LRDKRAAELSLEVNTVLPNWAVPEKWPVINARPCSLSMATLRASTLWPAVPVEFTAH